MHQNLATLYGSRVATVDGEIGLVQDFYFDPRTWALRYLVVDTGAWLRDRQILLAPYAFAKWDHFEDQLRLKLSRAQIERSPRLARNEPVSRPFENDSYRYYGWPAYWLGAATWGGGDSPLAATTAFLAPERRPTARQRQDPALRSAQAVAGSPIEAADGPLGHVTGLQVNERTWTIAEVVVATGPWLAGREVLISAPLVKVLGAPGSGLSARLRKRDLETPEAESAHAAG